MEEEWRENFRMSRETFQVLCAELYPYIFKNDTRFRNAVPVEKQVAATSNYLSDEGQMRKVANAFRIGKSTVSIIIRDELQKQYLFIWHQNIYKYLAQNKKFKRW